MGYKVVADISYPSSATDVSSEVSKLIVAKPDVLLHASYITDAILFTKTFKEKGFQPKGIITMAGYIEPGYLPAVKADGNYIFVRSTFATRSWQESSRWWARSTRSTRRSMDTI